MNDLEVVDQSHNQGGALVESEKAEAIQRVQAAYVIARRFPRQESLAIANIRKACKRESLAEVALYSYPRGGKPVTGPSIRLAEVLAQCWGNIEYGMKELENVEGINGYSVIEAFCSDLETNVHQRRTFKIYHKRKAQGSIKHLDDPRDVYELVANYGQRRVRAAILGVIPRDVTEAAVNEIKQTLKVGSGEPLQDRVAKMLFAFQELGVTHELVERRLGHEIKTINDDELVELRSIFTSLKDGETKRQEWFELSSSVEGGKAAELNEKLKGKK